MADFYQILETSRDATQREIKEAYLKLIKKYHPDLAKNSLENTKKTQEINEAYSILKDTVKRSKYDSLLILKEQYGSTIINEEENYSEHEENSEQTYKETPDIVCEKCGKSDSTLRVSIFIKVICFLIFSSKEGWCKILCSRCRIKYTLLWCTEVWLFGWWSPYGLFWSMDALIKNGKGGVQPAENNLSLLKYLVYKFYRTGRYDEAYSALKEVIKISPNNSQYEHDFMNYLSNFIKKEKPKIFSRFISAPTFIYGYSYILILLLLTGFLFSFSGGVESKNNQPKIQTTTKVKSNPTPKTTNPTSKTDTKPKTDTPELKKQDLPRNGTIKFYSKKRRIAPLKITASAFENHFIKIFDYYSDELVLTIFIRAGKSVQTNVPLGVYGIKYAVGADWYGEKYLFGKWTNYYKTSESFEFKMINDRVRGWEIELYLRVNGNLHTEEIYEDDF